MAIWLMERNKQLCTNRQTKMVGKKDHRTYQKYLNILMSNKIGSFHIELIIT